MSREEMRTLQGKRLHKMVDYVYHNVPFYRHKLQALGILPDDITTIDDIRKLPFTTKQDLRDNYPFGLQAAPMSEIIRVHASTGTTGKPTIVGYTRHDIGVWSECMTRCLSAYGVTRDDIFSVAYGYGLFTGGLGAHYGVENLGAAVVPASTGNSEKHCRLICDLGITGIACTPSYALYLAETMERLGIKREDIHLRIGAFGAEPWTENMRHEIESRLGLKAYNLYGLSEIMGPCVSYECSEQHYSHINEDHFFPEIINPDTLKPLPMGETGELVFTTLTKEGMPLLRYRTKDLCSLTDEPCPCGRTSVRKAEEKAFPIECDYIIVAIGQSIHSQPFEKSSLKFVNGVIAAESSSFVPGSGNMFAGGDAVSGPATVIRAVAAGKVAANNIDYFLGYYHVVGSDVEVPIPQMTNNPPCGRVNLTIREMDDLEGNFDLVSEGMTPQGVRQECGRCLRCDHFGLGSFRGGRKIQW